LPKSLSLGKSEWQVVQEVPYRRENAGIALAEGERDRTTNTTTKGRASHLRFMDRPQYSKSQSEIYVDKQCDVAHFTTDVTAVTALDPTMFHVRRDRP